MPKDIRYQIAIDGQPSASLTGDVAEIEIVESIDEPSSFRVRFASDVCDGDVTLIGSEQLVPSDPDRLLSVLVVVNGETTCLVHGPIAKRQANLVQGGPGSWVEVSGSDRRLVMNRETRNTHFSGKASEIVQQILESYEFEADVEQTTIEYTEDGHTLAQVGTDLDFVNSLAGTNDFRFWLDWELTSNPFGALEVKEIAHFKPSPPQPQAGPLGVPIPQLAPDGDVVLKLNTDVEGCSNVSSFYFESDAEVPNRTGQLSRVAIDDSELDPTQVDGATTDSLGGTSQPGQTRTRRIVTAGSVEEARVVNNAAINDAAWSVQARAETTVFSLGALPRAHQVIQVNGGGERVDGSYFVRTVTHAINQADHRLSLELLRNAEGG